MSSVDLSLSGLASGLDWTTLITALANAERSPETRWKATQTTIANKNSAFDTIKSDLSTLQADVKKLQDSTLYDSRTASTSDSATATVSADTGAAVGSYSFVISQLATASKITGSTGLAKAISTDGDLSQVTLGTARFNTAVTAGTFTIDGQQITVATTDSLQDVFDRIKTATSDNVTASYDSNTDKITLTSADKTSIVLGSAADTSNFLQVAKLYSTNNDGTGSVASNAPLGSVRLTTTLADSDLLTGITAGTDGTGSFTINGVSISFDLNNDTLQNVMDRINNSAAGVTASYDSQNKGFVLSNKTTGDAGIAVADVSGNFLAATGLSGQSLTYGKNLLYTLNGGSTKLVSQSNTITSASSGITGLSVTALATGSVTATVSADTSKIKSAIQSFITDYNSVQTFISLKEATSTDSSNSVTAGLLTGDQDASEIASSLRSLSFSVSSVGGLSSSMNQLADLGISTGGYTNVISLSDSSALDNALTNSLGSVKALFSDSTNGLAVKLNNYLDNTIGDNGTLVNHQATLSKQSASIDTQIATLEKTVTAESANWKSEFVAMETAQAQINQQMTYLTKAFSSSSG